MWTPRVLVVLSLIAALALGFFVGKANGAEAKVPIGPSASVNWSPRPDCFNYRLPRGSVAPFPLRDVVAEYRNKVGPLPTPRVQQGCSGAEAQVNVRLRRGVNFCSKYHPEFGPSGQETILLKPSRFCKQHAREFMCSAIGGSVGQNFYNQPRPGTRKGCMWTGIGPNHVSRVEDKVLSNAWG